MKLIVWQIVPGIFDVSLNYSQKELDLMGIVDLAQDMQVKYISCRSWLLTTSASRSTSDDPQVLSTNPMERRVNDCNRFRGEIVANCIVAFGDKSKNSICGCAAELDHLSRGL